MDFGLFGRLTVGAGLFATLALPGVVLADVGDIPAMPWHQRLTAHTTPMPHAVAAVRAQLPLCHKAMSMFFGPQGSGVSHQLVSATSVHAATALHKGHAHATSAGREFTMPVSYVRVSSAFGYRRHPVRGVWHGHTGVDLVAPTGTQVKAAAQGVVKFIGFERRGYGRYVVINHRYNSETIYGHLSSTSRNLRVGMKVSAGQVIGAVGSTGMATGPHLHFELRRHGRSVDPMPLLREAVADEQDHMPLRPSEACLTVAFPQTLVPNGKRGAMVSPATPASPVRPEYPGRPHGGARFFEEGFSGINRRVNP
ncbi:Glycyl-glycine endopeptidase ALE-1 [Pandoraea iniqua]|uniref:M23 family metallopeptidase n=1 Tax=Pandoraea iniqua TaxID=2508288 RepID=UPI00123F2A15|nr:M23 family metallopeptidase [Pandoraea iniqua]VVE13465.1 Glycyl-glycine endopeptidase ALE-1 [Pandoraea iniqua]